jgi:hypothetical protein
LGWRITDDGKYRTITEIAAAEEIDLGQASRIARLTQLAPDIIEACVNRQHNALMLNKLARRGIPPLWDEQRSTLLE